MPPTRIYQQYYVPALAVILPCTRTYSTCRTAIYRKNPTLKPNQGNLHAYCTALQPGNPVGKSDKINLSELRCPRRRDAACMQCLSLSFLTDRNSRIHLPNQSINPFSPFFPAQSPCPQPALRVPFAALPSGPARHPPAICAIIQIPYRPTQAPATRLQTACKCPQLTPCPLSRHMYSVVCPRDTRPALLQVRPSRRRLYLYEYSVV